MLTALVLCTLVIVLATTLPLSRLSHWIIRGLDFPRLQIASLAAVLLILQCLFFDTLTITSSALIAATTLCLAWQLWWILPYTVLWPKEVKTSRHNSPDRQLSIITSNVLTPNRNSDALIALVNEHQPDILVTLESDLWWQEKLSVLETDMPYSVKCPLDNLYGMHVFSKLPFDQEEISYLVEDGVPSIHLSLAMRSGHKVRMHFLHPAPPSPTENTESAERDAELLVVARSIANTQQPAIVTGDLNDAAWSPTTRLFRKISGLLDPRVGRGMFNTYHVDYPFTRWPLDHLFHSQHFTLKHIQRLPSIGSDHFPLFTTLMFMPTQGDDQKGLSATTDDFDRVKAICKHKDVKVQDVPEPEA